MPAADNVSLHISVDGKYYLIVDDDLHPESGVGASIQIHALSLDECELYGRLDAKDLHPRRHEKRDERFRLQLVLVDVDPVPGQPFMATLLDVCKGIVSAVNAFDGRL